VANWLCDELDSFVQTPEINRKYSKIFLKNAKNKNQAKIKKIPNNEIQLAGGPFFTFSLPGWRRAPLPPVSYATDCSG